MALDDFESDSKSSESPDFGSDYDPKSKGEATEAAIISDLVANGAAVLTPFGDNQRYDLVVDNGSEFVSIQCKTGNLKDGKVEFRCQSKNRSGGDYDAESYSGDVDCFAVYCHELDQTYIVPVEDAPDTVMYLRVEKPKNNQSKGVNLAEDYEL